MTLSCRVVSDLFWGVRQLVQQHLARAQVLHFASDINSSQGAMHAFLSLTRHWWEVEAPGNTQRQETGRPIEYGCDEGQPHSSQPSKGSEGHAAALQPTTEDQGLFVTYNGANMVAALQSLRLRVRAWRDSPYSQPNSSGYFSEY